MSSFDDDTALVPLGDGRFAGRMDRGWWIERGPNGGYIAAVVLRAAVDAVGDEERTPRSLTVHYVRPPVEGPVELATVVERAGRSLTTVSVRMVQGGQLVVLALAALGVTRRSPLAYAELPAPSIPPWDDVAPVPPPPNDIPMRARWDLRWAIGGLPFAEGPPPEGGDGAETGGWIRLVERRPIDHLLVAAVTDAWPPAVFTRTAEPIGVPTVDLTVHFRGPVPPPSMAPDDPFLVRFRTRVVAEGFFEEDGEVWSPDGVLLAQSRQLGVVLAPLPA